MISVVSPFRNERESLPALLSEITHALGSDHESYEVILVDDGSSDGSAALAGVGQALHLIRLPKAAGQSAAIWQGIKNAEGEWVVTIDADLQNDPADIPRMLQLARAGDYDLVCGWRENVQENALRRFSSRIANIIRTRLLGDPAHDSGCTLKVMKTSFAKRLPNWDGMHRFIPTYAAMWGLRQTEMPVRHRRRLHGKSKTWQLARAFKATRDLIRMLGEKQHASL